MTAGEGKRSGLWIVRYKIKNIVSKNKRSKRSQTCADVVGGVRVVSQKRNERVIGAVLPTDALLVHGGLADAGAPVR